MALTLNGKKRNLHRNDFLKFADACGMDRMVAGRLIDRLINRKDDFIDVVNDSFLTADLKNDLQMLVIDRSQALGKNKK